MTTKQSFENQIKTTWEEANASGQILFRSDTLTTRDVPYEGTSFHLIHNACRDVYDKATKAIDKPAAPAKPFADGSNPELAVTEDGWFRVVGNRFACVRYQCVLVPVQPLEAFTPEFLEAALRFAEAHPTLTLMYNALGAGKTVPAQFWLLSFARYDALVNFPAGGQSLCTSHGLNVFARREPCYALRFDFGGKIGESAAVLLDLVRYMGGRNFNIFLYDRHAVFIPRENIEIPSGFAGHRFGGLEMLGCFVMKSLDALQTADPAALLRGMREIGYTPENQQKLEAFLRGLGEPN
jgi:hypothetical protein